jgi:hypothetical protein
MTINREHTLICDGCGQAASAEHLAARLRRLEWATRWRPLHIQTLLLGAVAPANDSDFIYADANAFGGEAASVLRVAGIAGAGKPADTVHHELQRTGIFVSYLLDCPLEGNPSREALAQLLAKRVPTTLTRIRRSIKPKRVALISPELDALLDKFTPEALGCDVILDSDKAFKLSETVDALERLRTQLSLSAVAR